jgi:putative transposase
MVFHVLNRANARLTIFRKDADYVAFEDVLAEAVKRTGMRLLAYCIMPNHWHQLLWPTEDDQVSEMLRWMSVTHSNRWHAHHHSAGTGHLYQGRFKSFPIEADDHLLVGWRYVERNALRAGLVKRLRDWRWCSLAVRRGAESPLSKLLHPGPIDLPDDWERVVDEPQTATEVEAMRRCIARGKPFGSDAWQQRSARRLGLELTLHPRGRPRKNEKGSWTLTQKKGS